MDKKILEKIPQTWKDVKVKDYEALSELTISEGEDLFVGVDNTLKVLSYFTGLSIEDLEQLSLNDITVMSKRLDFMMKMPEIDLKSKIQWKKMEEITYNDFILYQQFSQDFFKNLHLLIPAFSKSKITEEEVLEMNLEEMNTAFFFLRKHVTKSLKRTAFYLKLDQVNQKMAEKIMEMVYRLKLKSRKQ